MTFAWILLLGAIIGVVLGGMGGGGATLTVPALVYLAGQDAQDATTGSLIIVGVTALAAVVGHARAGAVRWRIGAQFALAGIGGAVLGSALNQLASTRFLILSCAALLLVSGALMLRHARRPGPVGVGDTATAKRAGAGAVGRVAGAGVAVGFLTGFLGVGGGFVIVPALVLAVGLPMNAAVGTSLLIIAANCATALAARTGVADLDWMVIGPFAAAAMSAALGGRRLAALVPQRTVTRAFATLTLVVAGYMAVRTLALSS
ncbi:sulfite exporter TauE/SafE family protein [Pilimelia columellifera]|uniref:Probable membrane transporter protein n=1 Tax=Pilimelia columellifera subsp. columellifera TaxID=706583 RepID=A0ABP6AY51_9ACTN